MIYFDRSIPLFDRAIWFFNIPVNSARMLLKLSSAWGIFTRYLFRERERRLIKESWNGKEVSK